MREHNTLESAAPWPAGPGHFLFSPVVSALKASCDLVVPLEEVRREVRGTAGEGPVSNPFSIVCSN